MYRLTRVVAAGVIALVFVLILTATFRPASGPLALLGILAPHLALVGLVIAVPVAILRDDRVMRVAAIALVTVTVARFGSEWVSVPASADAGDTVLQVATWNLEFGAVGSDTMLAGLADSDVDVDVVSLQELTFDHADAIEADADLARRFPHQALYPDAAMAGIGLLSRWPIEVHETGRDPVLIEADVRTDAGPVRVVAAHPFPARIATATPLRIPTGFDAAERDARLVAIRDRVDAALDRGEPVIVLGDFNVAPTEPGYAILADGLRDAHVEAGMGPGWTWRPSRFESLPIGLLRIDLVLTSPDLRPISTALDCSRAGDHCLLRANIAVDVPGSRPDP